MANCYEHLARFQYSEQAMGHYDSATATNIPVFALAIAKPRSSTASASEDEPWQTVEHAMDSKLIDVGWRFEQWLALCICWLTNVSMLHIFSGRICCCLLKWWILLVEDKETCPMWYC